MLKRIQNGAEGSTPQNNWERFFLSFFFFFFSSAFFFALQFLNFSCFVFLCDNCLILCLFRDHIDVVGPFTKFKREDYCLIVFSDIIMFAKPKKKKLHFKHKLNFNGS